MDTENFSAELKLDFWEYVACQTAIKWFLEFGPDESKHHKIREQAMVVQHRLCNISKDAETIHKEVE